MLATSQDLDIREDVSGTERQLSAGDLRRIAGLSYRQLNDWDSKGILPESRDKDRAWRRFSPRDVFVLMVLSEIRKRFGVPLESLGWVKAFMLQEGANHLYAAAQMMALLGVGVYVITDLQETFLLETDVEMANLLKLGTFGGDEPKSLIWVKVNPLVNRLLALMKEPIQLKAHGRGYEIAAGAAGVETKGREKKTHRSRTKRR